MEAPVALNIVPLNSPHKSLKWLPLADRDYQMMETIELSSRYHILVISEIKARHINGIDVLGI